MLFTHDIVKTLSHLLKQQNRHFVTAESCTGGGVAFVCTSQSGSSAWFNGSFVTYTNDMKKSMLNVSQDVLVAHGAVSEPTVIAMLKGSLHASNADVSLAISGIAGPDGATESKPVGTVCFAYGGHSDYQSHTCIFNGDRQKVREQAIHTGLQLVVDYLSAS